MSQSGSGPLLLISNSTAHGSGYLDYVEEEIREFLGSRRRIAFVPYALHDRVSYATKARERFQRMGYLVHSVDEFADGRTAIAECDAIFVGGGNTFRLVNGLHRNNLISAIKAKVAAGTPYVGASAGSIVAGPSLKTTKDMPVVQPPSFDALGLMDFHVSPHYLDPDPTTTHMGETQEERIMQFLEENDSPVVGLREGTMLVVRNGAVLLKGSRPVRLFRRESNPIEAPPGTDLSEHLQASSADMGSSHA